MKHLKSIPTLIWMGALLVGLLAGCSAGSPAAPQPDSFGVVLTPVPSPTPRVIDFTVKDLDGNEVSLSDLRGQVVLVNFWATWCSPCKEEMPVLEAYYQANKDEEFVIVAVNVSEDAATAQSFIEEHGYTFPVWSDPPGKQLMKLGIRGLPASLFLDRDGALRQFWSGPLDAATLDEIAGPLINP